MIEVLYGYFLSLEDEKLRIEVDRFAESYLYQRNITEKKASDVWKILTGNWLDLA